MAVTTLDDRFLLSFFAEFYEEVATLKLALRNRAQERRAADREPGGADAELDGARKLASMNSADQVAHIHSRLLDRLQRQEHAVRRQGTAEELRLYRIAQYVMAALADEIFILQVTWRGRTMWPDHLLEQKLFRRATAGRDFYTYADRILQYRQRTRAMEDLASLFLIALQLGFQGQYRGCEAKLAEYRDNLLQFIGLAPAEEQTQALFAKAYQGVLHETEEKRLRPMARWYQMAAVGGVLYLLTSTAIWLISTYRFAPPVD